MNNKGVQIDATEKKSEIPKSHGNSQEPSIPLPKSFNFYDELQKFAIEDIIAKRNHFEEDAKKMEKWLLFKSAAIFYEKCENVSLQLVHLGKAEEKIKVENYRNKKLECLKENSVG